MSSGRRRGIPLSASKSLGSQPPPPALGALGGLRLPVSRIIGNQLIPLVILGTQLEGLTAYRFVLSVIGADVGTYESNNELFHGGHTQVSAYHLITDDFGRPCSAGFPVIDVFWYSEKDRTTLAIIK